MFTLFKKNPHKIAAARLYDQIKQAARDPYFYRRFGVPDTLEGRFGVLSLYTFVIFFHLKAVSAHGRREADTLAQAVFDVMFQDIEAGMREAGVGDLSVPRKIKQMMEALNGSCFAYAQAFDSLQDGAVAGRVSQVLARNLYGDDCDHRQELIADLVDYTLSLRDKVMMLSYEEMMKNGCPFLFCRDLCEGKNDDRTYTTI